MAIERRVSVVMPVLNALPHLDAAVTSILRQSHEDFELVCVDDGSADGSWEALERWARRDDRVRLFHSRETPGMASSSNEAVRRSTGALVARMDADDISHPERLARQVELMERRADCVVCGTMSDGIDARDRRVRPVDRSRLVRPGCFSPFPHGSALFRREDFDAVGGYRSACDGWEEFDLWARLAGRGSVLVIAEGLYRYRYRFDSATTKQDAARAAQRTALRSRAERQLHVGASYDELDLTSPPSTRELDEGGQVAELERAAHMLWAGVPTPSRRLRGGPKARLYGSVGAWAPKLLRRFLAIGVAWRDRCAARRLAGATEVEWRFGSDRGAMTP